MKIIEWWWALVWAGCAYLGSGVGSLLITGSWSSDFTWLGVLLGALAMRWAIIITTNTDKLIMRISAIKTDPGYNTEAGQTEILLDGIKLDNCYTADEELGEAGCYVKGSSGRHILDDSGKFLKTECKYDNIVIRGYNE